MSSDNDSDHYQREKFSKERIEDEDEQDVFGPTLPPHLLKKADHKDEDCNARTRQDSDSEENVYGPVLPKHLRKPSQDDLTEAGSSSDVSYGPKLPDNMKTRPSIGPKLPEHLKPSLNEESEDEEEEEDAASDEDNFFGPSPDLMAKGNITTYRKNFSKSKEDEEKESNVNQRESWMLELPPEKAAKFGLGPRQFKTRISDRGGDRSAWTDTPADKERKRKHPEVKDDSHLVRQKVIEERDKEMERLVRKAEKKAKRKESLVEIHQKKMKKQAKKEAEKREKEGRPVERRPFNRETDLQVNRFDESQKRAVLKKAQFLNDRFASGESKFL